LGDSRFHPVHRLVEGETAPATEVSASAEEKVWQESAAVVAAPARRLYRQRRCRVAALAGEPPAR